MSTLHIQNQGHVATTDVLLDGQPFTRAFRINLEGFDRVVTATCEVAATCDLYAAYDLDAVATAWHAVQRVRLEHFLEPQPLPTPQVPPHRLLLHIVAAGARDLAPVALTRAWLPNGQPAKWIGITTVELERRMGFPRATLCLMTAPPRGEEEWTPAIRRQALEYWLAEYEHELAVLLGVFDPAAAIDPQKDLD